MKYKLFYPHKSPDGKAGMNPLLVDRGKHKGEPKTFKTEREALDLAAINGWPKALAIPVGGAR